MIKTEIEFYRDILTKLSHTSSVSGYETYAYKQVTNLMRSYASNIVKDNFGNIHMIKDGESPNYTFMAAAHLDEIGLMVTRLDERGFLHFTNIGGVDPRTLLNQEVIVHGKEDILGIVCMQPREKEKKLELSHLGIDIGLERKEAQELIKPGDVISIKRECIPLLNNLISGKSIDDKAGITALAVMLNELTSVRHKQKVNALATVQEEVGLRGAGTGTYNADPAIAVAIDVTHAKSLDTKTQVQAEVGKGPVIAIGPNINTEIAKRLCSCAMRYNIPYQVNPIPGPTGTDARAIQLTRCGIPTALISIPMRYMHTSVETVSMLDIFNCGRLLALFVSTLPDQLEEILCY